MYALIGWGLHHILLFSFLAIFQFQGGCIAFCQCVWGSDKQNLVEKSTKDASEIDGTLFKRKLLRFYWFHWINLVKLLAYRDTNYHCNYINYAQCFPQDPCIFKFKGSFFLTVYWVMVLLTTTNIHLNGRGKKEIKMSFDTNTLCWSEIPSPYDISFIDLTKLSSHFAWLCGLVCLYFCLVQSFLVSHNLF